jgi:hypothetical protein
VFKEAVLILLTETRSCGLFSFHIEKGSLSMVTHVSGLVNLLSVRSASNFKLKNVDKLGFQIV